MADRADDLREKERLMRLAFEDAATDADTLRRKLDATERVLDAYVLERDALLAELDAAKELLEAHRQGFRDQCQDHYLGVSKDKAEEWLASFEADAIAASGGGSDA